MGSVLRFQNLDVYRAAIEFAARAIQLARRMPRGQFELRDQMTRASSSIALNIAEGCGRASPGDASRFYLIARGSAFECAAILDVMKTLGVVSTEDHQACTELLERIVSMLTRLAQIRP